MWAHSGKVHKKQLCRLTTKRNAKPSLRSMELWFTIRRDPVGVAWLHLKLWSVRPANSDQAAGSENRLLSEQTCWTSECLHCHCRYLNMLILTFISTLTQVWSRSGLYIRISEGPALVGVCCFSSISPPNPTFKDFFANELCRNMLN